MNLARRTRQACVLALACAASCTRSPSLSTSRAHVRVALSRYDGSEMVMARCLVDGASGPVRYAWKLGGAVRAVGWGVALDEEALLVQPVGPPNPPASIVECRVTPAASDGGAGTISAWASLAPLLVRGVSATRERLIIDGSGFGPSRGDDDAVYLVPARGAELTADHGCAGASWSDSRIVACPPRDAAPGPYQLRVESARRLALGPTWTPAR
jgi:hypothetical protein